MRWPDVVWGAAALRGVDERGRAEIEAAGALQLHARGDMVFASGEPADDFFVVEAGEVEVRGVARGEEGTRLLRKVGAGEAFGEESLLRAGASRQIEARCAKDARVARVPATIYARAAERAGGDALFSAKRRSLERAATLDLLGTMALTRDLGAADLEALADASKMRSFVRSATIFRAGDRADEMLFLVDGMVQLQLEADGRAHVRAYLGRGDEIGDVAIERGAIHETTAIASGAATVLAIRGDAVRAVAARHAGFFARARTKMEETADRQARLVDGALTTQHVLKDLYRLEVARSLLVIDQESCVRCGHCAWSCASAHDDGVARIVRRGDKIVTGQAEGAATLLLPNSCQHCENPACMLDCPTGAIGRDPKGDVFIRESICIGCGNCAKGCPWDNIQMAPRLHEKAENQALSATIAVKCDVCEGRDEGPACVAACPVEAIARVVPTDAMAEVRIARGEDVPALPRILAKPAPARPWWSGAALVAIAVTSGLAQVGAFTTGFASAFVCLALAVYPLFKRVAKLRAIGRPKIDDPERAHRSRVRVHYVAHVALGFVAIGLVVAHTHLRAGPSLAGALVVAFAIAAAFGGAGAFFYAFVPKALARLDRKGALPEDVGPRLREARDRTASHLSGKDELVKTIFARVLTPYVDSKIGTIGLIFSSRSLREEERRLHAMVEAMLGGRGKGRREGLDALVRDVVERRGLEGERWLHWLVRGWLAFHVVASVLVVALLIAHAIVEIVYPR